MILQKLLDWIYITIRPGLYKTNYCNGWISINDWFDGRFVLKIVGGKCGLECMEMNISGVDFRIAFWDRPESIKRRSLESDGTV